mmetsp:Transcript_23884/g.61535  ORF Transcript_23884/g.61535 Transcript_23884/m.61535 type:complete len:224 (-) Transcript_23884:757-1428(-)
MAATRPCPSTLPSGSPPAASRSFSSARPHRERHRGRAPCAPAGRAARSRTAIVHSRRGHPGTRGPPPCSWAGCRSHQTAAGGPSCSRHPWRRQSAGSGHRARGARGSSPRARLRGAPPSTPRSTRGEECPPQHARSCHGHPRPSRPRGWHAPRMHSVQRASARCRQVLRRSAGRRLAPRHALSFSSRARSRRGCDVRGGFPPSISSPPAARSAGHQGQTADRL